MSGVVWWFVAIVGVFGMAAVSEWMAGGNYVIRLLICAAWGYVLGWYILGDFHDYLLRRKDTR